MFNNTLKKKIEMLTLCSTGIKLNIDYLTVPTGLLEMCIPFATVIFKAKSVFEFFMTFPFLLGWFLHVYGL